jgi:superfamily II DNA or RNA helicase
VKYQNKEVEILSTSSTFGKHIAEIRILATGEVKRVPQTDLKEPDGEISVDELAFKAMAARIRNEVQTQTMLAPFESNIIPLPHQILALEKVMSGQFLRFLMADEVGMGKTIETGLVLKELKLRGIVKRALIIVPKSAMLQWKQELKKHFNESFHIYDTDYINTLTRTFTRLEADNEINIWTQHNFLIVPMDALKPVEGRQGWNREKVAEHNRYRIQSVLDADFDLLVIDECHKVGGSNSNVGRYQMADILCSAIPNVLLLSATPHRGKSDHFRRILRLLDSDAFAGEGAPTIRELEPYVVRTEKRQAIDYTGKLLFNKRQTETIEVKYDPIRHQKQQQLYEAVSQYVISGFNLAQQTRNTSYGFVMILFQRLMSSSTQAILEAMQGRADRLSGERGNLNATSLLSGLSDDNDYVQQLELNFDAQLNALVADAAASYTTELEQLQGLILDARDCLATETDAKVEFLMDKLATLKRAENNPDLKFLIFTEFTSTQSMLRRVLTDQGGYGCEFINGSMSFEQRIDALKKFKESAQILISTDAAGESLNMQFAHIIINFDMPWNPMVVEQRIGRVDRIGQPFEVLALNLLLDNSIDRRVYEVIETKLTQIMEEMGIDKTSDVLDSTLETDRLSRLYLTSLLDPGRFEAESATWLEDIKHKLRDYQSTEGALPTLTSSAITTEKADSVRYSPLPNWLESLSRHYLKTKAIPYTYTTAGLSFRFPGRNEQIYTYDIKEGLNNPIPEPLSLQHEIVQTMLADAVPCSDGQPIPRVQLTNGKSAAGWWSLWQLKVKNDFEEQQSIYPLFCTPDGDRYVNFAQDVWNKLSTETDYARGVGVVEGVTAKEIMTRQNELAEETLADKYRDMESAMLTNTEKIQQNKERAFAFQERQLARVGIGNIRQARLLRLQRERDAWQANFDQARQIIPELRCLLMLELT